MAGPGSLKDFLGSLRQDLRTNGGENMFSELADGTLVDDMGNIVEPQEHGLDPNVVKSVEAAPNTILGLEKDSGKGRRGQSLLANVGQLASLAIPGFVAHKNFKGQDDGPFTPESDKAHFRAPVVRGLVRPRFTTRFRRARGSSLAEREGGLRFADAQNDARRDQFEARNQQFIQQQESRNAQILNREEAFNTQIENRERFARANELASQQERKESAGNAALSALTSNLSNVINQRTIGNTSMNQIVFEELVRKGTSVAEAGQIAFGNSFRDIADRLRTE